MKQNLLTFHETSSEKFYKGSGKLPPEEVVACGLCSRPLLAVSVQIPCCPRMYIGTRFERALRVAEGP